jgi:septal ring factor EnvC (AmiA/AmiB activator)
VLRTSKPERKAGAGKRDSLVILVITLLAVFSADAQENRDQERDRAESELQQVLVEIEELHARLEDSRTEHKKEQTRLRQLDLAIQEVNLRYRALEEEKQSHTRELQRLEQQREDYLASLDEKLARLAEQVRSAYRNGGQSRTKLVLNQDDPTQVGRMLAYYDYVNRAQVEKIAGLRDAVTRLEDMQQDIDAELDRVAGLQQEQQNTLDQLGEQRASRTALMEQIAGRIDRSESELRELEQNRRDLQELVERLADMLADIPDDLEAHSGVASRKGSLPMPVKGPVRHAFGQSRSVGLDSGKGS